MQSLFILSLFTMLTSCGHLYTHRDFTAEMQHDDSKFYEPRVDFPIVTGDSGDVYESQFTRRARTPAAEQETEAYLIRELHLLEGSLSLNEFSQYEEFEGKLPTVSEKIYFLKLPRSERKFYLISKGLLEDQGHQIGMWVPEKEPTIKAEVERKPASEGDIWPFREYLKQETP